MTNGCCGNSESKREQPACCTPNTGSTPDGIIWRRVFLMLLLPLVTAVTTYSVVIHETGGVWGSPADLISNDTTALVLVETIEDAFLTMHDLVIIVLPADDGTLDPALVNCAVSTAAAIQEADGRQPGIFINARSVGSTGEAEIMLSARNSSNTGYGTRYRIRGEINQARLMQAYLAAFPDSALACCP